MSIGATLQAARQQAGLSVDDVATSTRIRATLIRQIENDNFDACGGAIYARGHIRNIAAAVGIDPAPIVAEFNQSHVPAAEVTAHQILDRAEIVQRAPSGPNWTAAMLVVAILLAGVALVSLLTGPDGTPSTDAVKSTPAVSAPAADVPTPPDAAAQESAAEPTAPAEPASQPASEPAASAPADASSASTPPPSTPASAPATSAPPAVVAFNGVQLRISVTGDKCWVYVSDVSAGKKVLYTGTLQRGAVRDFTATGKLVVTFGNAGAVALTVNGHPLGAPGGSGQVVTVPFAPGDPAAG